MVEGFDVVAPPGFGPGRYVFQQHPTSRGLRLPIPPRSQGAGCFVRVSSKPGVGDGRLSPRRDYHSGISALRVPPTGIEPAYPLGFPQRLSCTLRPWDSLGRLLGIRWHEAPPGLEPGPSALYGERCHVYRPAPGGFEFLYARRLPIPPRGHAGLLYPDTGNRRGFRPLFAPRVEPTTVSRVAPAGLGPAPSRDSNGIAGGPYGHLAAPGPAFPPLSPGASAIPPRGQVPPYFARRAGRRNVVFLRLQPRTVDRLGVVVVCQ